MKVDKRLAIQVLYHFCRLSSTDPEVLLMQKQAATLANQFHRVDECGKTKCREE